MVEMHGRQALFQKTGDVALLVRYDTAIDNGKKILNNSNTEEKKILIEIYLHFCFRCAFLTSETFFYFYRSVSHKHDFLRFVNIKSWPNLDDILAIRLCRHSYMTYKYTVIYSSHEPFTWH